MESPDSIFSYHQDLNIPIEEDLFQYQDDFGLFNETDNLYQTDTDNQYQINNPYQTDTDNQYQTDIDHQYQTDINSFENFDLQPYEDFLNFTENLPEYTPEEPYTSEEMKRQTNKKGKKIYEEDNIPSTYEVGSCSKNANKRNRRWNENDDFETPEFEQRMFGNPSFSKENPYFPIPVEYGDNNYQPEESLSIHAAHSVFKRLARKDKCSVARLLEKMGCAVTATMKRKILAIENPIHQGIDQQIPLDRHCVRVPVKFRLGPRVKEVTITKDRSKHNKLIAKAEKTSARMKAFVQKLRNADPTFSQETRPILKNNVWRRESSNENVINTPVEDFQENTYEERPKLTFEERLKKLKEDINQFSLWKKNSSYSSSEEVAEINMVETRSTSSARNEENTTEELRSIIQQRDEQINRLEQRMEELATALQNAPTNPLPTVEIIRPETIHISEDKKEPVDIEESTQKQKDSAHSGIPEKDITQLVEQKVKESMAQAKAGSLTPKGRPYPEEFDTVQYPKGFVPPVFKMFDGTGNPRQHLAHFRASCCNAGGSDALLFRQFVNSLTGVAFDWYVELPNGSVKTFIELESLFIQRFAGAQHHTTVGDLVVEKQKPGESLVDYILRWRNLSMKCEPQLQEQHAVEILLKNIHGPIAFMLKGFTIKTFEKLLSKAANLQEEAKQMSVTEKVEKTKTVKTFEKKPGNVVEKGKQVMQVQPEQKKQQRQNQSSPQISSQIQQPVPISTDKRTMAERMNKEYPFKTEAVSKIFRSLLKMPEFKLPEAKRPAEVDMKDNPNYCPYHRMLGHKIEDCFVFKDWLERNFKDGNIVIPKEYLKEFEKGSVNMIIADKLSNDIIQDKTLEKIFLDYQVTKLPKKEKKKKNKEAKKTRGFPVMGTDTPFVSSSSYVSTPSTRVVISDKGRKILKPIMLYDFLFTAVNNNNASSAYILSILDDASDNECANSNPIDNAQIVHDLDQYENNQKNENIDHNFDNNKNENDIDTLQLQGNPIFIELESSDSEIKESNDQSEEIIEINLRSGKILPPRMGPQEKDRQIITSEKIIPLMNSQLPERKEDNVHNKVDYNVLAHLRKLPAKLSIYDALMLSKEMRESLIKALSDPDICLAQLPDEIYSSKESTKITFSDNDLLLGTTEHNRPLYITVNINDTTLSRVLIDPGASINIMNLKTLAYLDIDASQLSRDTMMLRGFNQQGERALGSITLLLKTNDLMTTAKFHIIDSDTSFNALLGRPWLHEYKMVPSSLHQCIKYLQKGQECCIIGDLQPFSVHEIGIHQDASYYTPIKKTTFSEKPIENIKEKNKEEKINGKDQPSLTKTSSYQTHTRGRGRGRGRGKEDPTIIIKKPLVFKAHQDSERNTKIEMTTMVSKEPRFKIPLEKEDKGKQLESMYDKINHYIHSMTLTPISTNKVENLVVKEICNDDKKPIKFRLGSSSSNDQNDVLLEDENLPKSMKIPFELYSPWAQKFIQNSLMFKQWSLEQPHLIEKMWENNKRNPNSKEGIGFGTLEPLDDTEFCLVITEEHGFEPISDLPIENAPPELEEEIKSTIDELKEINLGTDENPKPTFISSFLNDIETKEIIQLLTEYKDCFAWTYDEMPGLSPEVAVHKLGINQITIPVKQAPRRMRVEIEQQVNAEIKKLIEAGFIREENYPTWLANVVPVKKKNGQIRVCIDFRDLNKACPKDEFPLPIPELMVDIASTHAIFSFMDGSSGYNQIKMFSEDETNTAFRTPIGIYCYKVMPFGLKNAGATYQRAMTRIFDELIHNQVECYVDDLVVNSKQKNDHIYDLRIVFERLRQYNLKMNPLKCAFGVTSGKFLGFIVRHRGIEIDPLKIEAILNMPPPKNLTQLRSFQGKLAYIRRFISNLSGRCQPLTALTRKDTEFIWDEKCQYAFENIKQYLTTPPVLAAPILGKPLILYTAALDNSLGALLAQINEEGKENALYYLSRCLVSTEIRYPAIEKHCLALIFAAQKLRHYMLSHKVTLISRVNPLQYLMTRPTLSGRLARWAMILLQFDITFVPLRAVKGQILADFLAAHPIPTESPLNDDLPDEQILEIRNLNIQQWELYFDGASSAQKDKDKQTIIPGKAGVGLIFVTPDKMIMPFSYHLTEPCTNNEAEYEALITGLELTILMEIKDIHIYGDSQLIINQIAGKYKILKPRLEQYFRYTLKLLQQIPNVTFFLIPRRDNSSADALAKLAKEFACPEEDDILVSIRGRQVLSQIDIDNMHEIEENIIMTTIDETEDWRQPIIQYLQTGRLPDNSSTANQIKQRALSYALINNVLYKRSFDQMWLRCLNQAEAQEIVKEVHSGLCGAHQSGPKMKMKIKRMGYYWPTMMTECLEIARKCHQCQVHGVVLHQPPNVLHPTIASWPFECWGTDIVGPIDPPSSKGHKFILAATDYFSKWAEAIPLREVKAEQVLHFFKTHIVYRFGIPRRVISDNGLAFKNTKMNNFIQRHGIDWRYSTIYYPKANGLAEAFNKTLIRILKKTLANSPKQWHEKLIEALWAYRTTYRTPTKSTPFTLVYGSEAILPLEIQVPSLRIAIADKITEEENAKLRLEELENLEGRRLQAQQNLELYQAKMIRAHDKLVRPRTFHTGELVLVLRRPILAHRKIGRKFEPIWEGPYVIEKVYSGGSYQLVDCNGDRILPPINGHFLKKYYAS